MRVPNRKEYISSCKLQLRHSLPCICVQGSTCVHAKILRPSVLEWWTTGCFKPEAFEQGFDFKQLPLLCYSIKHGQFLSYLNGVFLLLFLLAAHSQLYFSVWNDFSFSPSSRMIKVGRAQLTIIAGPTDAWQVTVPSNMADLTSTQQLPVFCMHCCLSIMSSLIMNYVHIHYSAVTKLAIIKTSIYVQQ